MGKIRVIGLLVLILGLLFPYTLSLTWNTCVITTKISGGKITIKMPDLDFLCRAYVSGIHSVEEIMIALFGGFSDYPGGLDGWEKISGNPQWSRNTIKEGNIPHPGQYTEWGGHKAMYTFESFKVRMEEAEFINVQRVVENDWELHIVASK